MLPRGAVPVVCLTIGVAPSAAFTPPELFVREITSNLMTGDDQDTGPWIPLAGARLPSVNNYRIGVRLQTSPAAGNNQRLLLLLHGAPTQDLLHGRVGFDVKGARSLDTRSSLRTASVMEA